MTRSVSSEAKAFPLKADYYTHKAAVFPASHRVMLLLVIIFHCNIHYIHLTEENTATKAQSGYEFLLQMDFLSLTHSLSL